MARRLILVGAILGFLSVAAGAIGSHMLRNLLDARQLGWFQTAAEYQMVHALLLVAIGAWIGPRDSRPAERLCAWAVLGGLLLFCGSLYAMALGAGTGLAILTPVGGVLLLTGWAMLAWSARGSATSNRNRE